MDAIKFNETANYQHITVLGKEGVFTPAYIDAASLPDGFHKYNLLPGEQSMFGAVTAGESGMSLGSFITKEPLVHDDAILTDDSWAFENKDFNFESHFGKKLSIDAQIEQAEAKRDMMLEDKGLGKSKDRSEPIKEL